MATIIEPPVLLVFALFLKNRYIEATVRMQFIIPGARLQTAAA